MLFNGSLNGPNGCYIMYDQTAKTISLTNDGATYWQPGIAPGTSGAYLENSQCEIDVGSSSVATSFYGETLTVHVLINFKSAFVGTKNTYLWANDEANQASGWQTLGSWTPYYSIGGTVTAGGVALSGVTMALTGSQTLGTTTAAGGNYSFSVAPGGSYTVRPSSVSYSFSPASQSFTNLVLNQANVNFSGTTPPSVTCSSDHNTVLVNQTVTFTSSPTGGWTPYQLAWSGPGVSGSNLSTQASFASPGTYSATIRVTDSDSMGTSGSCSVTVVPQPPTQWNGVNYGPRQHQYFRMLYDWYQLDSAVPGQYVYQTVDQDLTRLSQNGYNLLHLYLWDQSLLTQANSGEPAGFISAPGDPSQSPRNQWHALDDFVGRAESKGMYVALHFASGRFISQFQSNADPETSSTEFANWAGAFIQYLTPKHKNVLIWGLAYAISAIPGQPQNNWSVRWQKAYKKVDDIARANSPLPGMLGIIGQNLFMDIQPDDNDVHARPQGGYTFDVVSAQQAAKTMRDLLTQSYGYQRDPDVYMMQLYTANTQDLQNALQSLTQNTSGDPTRILVPATKIFVVEFATSSSISNSYNFSVASWGDSQTPTTTVAGQSQWLNNALCAYRNASSTAPINKYAYWAMYDPYVLWTTPPWNSTGQGLAWVGFWGLSNDYVSYGDKPAWTTLSSFYTSGSLTCPQPPIPIVSLLPNNDYFTVAQPIGVTWTAADVSSMSLSQAHGPSYSCTSASQLSSTDIAGSCAWTDANPFDVGSRSITLTGYNGSQTPLTASASFTVGVAPLVTTVTNASYSTTILTTDTIVVFGNGFSVTGGNTLQFTNSNNPDVWMYEGDSHYFWDQSYRQINAALDGRLAPGTWTVYVRNLYSGTPSSAFTITVSQ